MFQIINQITSDDGAMKALFDHIRNVGISAVVFGAAAWRYRNADEDLGFYVNAPISGALMFFGAFLFFVNQQHGIAKLRKAGYPSWLYHVVRFMYVVVTANILFSLVPQ